MTPPPHALRGDDVHKAYRSRRVIRGVSLRLEPGAPAGVVGENGSDKDGLQLLPGYGPTQVAVAAGFTPTGTPYAHLLPGPLRFLLMRLLGTAAFFARTRNHLGRPRRVQAARGCA